MKAIFVVQSEGRGHLTQALALKRILEREMVGVASEVANNRKK